jgi:polyisoprenyl-phosphate glycosyltransferase
VTLDEDGQHNPGRHSGDAQHRARGCADVVYALPSTPAPHGLFRNVTSRGSKRLIDPLVGGHAVSTVHSYRLVLGEIGCSIAAYAGAGVNLDVALGWVAAMSSPAR